jgi:hypothetical protein
MPEFDFGRSVAQDVNPVGQGMQTLSGLLDINSKRLGIQQQQQNLETGQALQQTAQAESQQAQQKNTELAAVGNLTKSAYSSGRYQNPDGSFNNQLFANDVSRVAPTYGQQVANDATMRAGEFYQNQKTLFSLNADRRKQVGDAFGALAAQVDPASGQPTVNHSQIIDTVEQLRQQNPDDPAYSRMLTSMVAGIPPTASGPQLQQMLRNAAVMTNAPSAAQTDPTIATMQGPKGLQAINTQPQAVGGVGPRGAPLPQGIAPQIANAPGGIPVVVPSGAKGAIASPAASGTVPATSQDWENFGGYQSNLNSRVAIASDSIPRIQMAEKALDSIRSGAGADTYSSWAKRLQAVGAPQQLVDAVGNGNLGAAQEAEKYLFQTTFSGLRQAMQGDPARVAEFQSAEQVFPSIGTDPRATKAVLGFMVDQGKRDYAEQQSLNTARKAGTFNPATWQGDYQAQLRAGKVPGVPSSQVPGGTAEGAKGLSKSGKPIVYRGGRWEYQ